MDGIQKKKIMEMETNERRKRDKKKHSKQLQHFIGIANEFGIAMNGIHKNGTIGFVDIKLNHIVHGEE